MPEEGMIVQCPIYLAPSHSVLVDDPRAAPRRCEFSVAYVPGVWHDRHGVEHDNKTSPERAMQMHLARHALEDIEATPLGPE